MDSASYGFEAPRRGDKSVYPMPFFVSLTVRDVAASAAWYQKMGFVEMFAMPGPGGQLMMSHLRWIKYADLMLQPGQVENVGAGVKLNFQVAPEDINLDELAAQMRAAGAEIVEGPVDRPWNTRELAVRDPDGYLLNFSQVDFARLQANQNSELSQMLKQSNAERNINQSG